VAEKRRRWLIWLLLALLLLVVAGLALRRAADTHLRAMSLLLRFSDPNAKGLATSFASHPIREELGSAQTPDGVLNFRLYIPTDLKSPGGVVLAHGIHHLGMEDPRLRNLARAFARAGVVVMTPELQDLADYHVTPRSINAIGKAALVLSNRMDRTVGVIGLSFAGGLALLAADREEFGKRIGYVLSIGGHDDMTRVAQFFASNEILGPDGREHSLQAHEYGVLVLAYSHLEDFFCPRDVPIAREALRQWLWEQPNAMKTAAGLSPKGRIELNELLHHRDLLRKPLLKEINLHQNEMAAVSPHDHLAGLYTPVYLLHGAGDTVIPATETEWLARDVPSRDLKATLISPALVHVDLSGGVTLAQKWQLVDLLSKVLRATDKLPKEIIYIHIAH
jgi:pimeloyl-ACP methyl ester carboxylesterase